MSRVPTKKQYELLCFLANPDVALVSGIGGPNSRTWMALLCHGWVAPRRAGIDRENGLRITWHGLRALAAALEYHGYPGDER